MNAFQPPLTPRVVYINPLSANPTKWPNTLKQFVGKVTTTRRQFADEFFECV